MTRDHTCVFTLQADRPGGVPTVVDWWVRYLNGWGHDATVLYAAFEGDGVTRRQRLAGALRTWRVRERPEHPNPTLAVASPPVPLWLFYFVPQFIAGPLLDRFDQIVVAGGPCLHALPLALRNRPYVLWLGTLYEDELRGKVLIGDAWAERTLNSPTWGLLARQERLVLRRASRIVAQSPYTQRRIRETVPEVADRLDLALVPVDGERFHPLPAGERRAGPRTVLNVSRINDPRKNIPLLLRAFAQARADHPDVRLVLAGDEPGPALLAEVEQLGIGEAVEFAGKVSAERLVELYQHADLFAISSTQEGLGIVMLEAMACGAPVVATDCGGPEGIVVDGQTGRLVANNDAAALGTAIGELLADPEGLTAMGERSAAYIRQHAVAPAVERVLYRHFSAVFPESQAAEAGLFTADEPDTAPTAPPRRKLGEWAALAWGLIVVAAYAQHQFLIHWPSIRDRLLGPLLTR